MIEENKKIHTAFICWNDSAVLYKKCFIIFIIEIIAVND